MQRVMKTLGAVTALALLTPAVAQAQQAGGTAAPGFTGALEFSFGFGGTATTDPDEGSSMDFDTSGPIAIIPALDKMLGKTVAVGGEVGFHWLGKGDGADDLDRTFVINPNLRLRMAFPIVDKVTFDGMIALGPAIWTANDSIPKLPNGDDAPGSGTRFGWAYRFNFGGSYQFNDAVSAFLTIGYYSTSSIGDDLTLTQSTVPINLGLRSAF